MASKIKGITVEIGGDVTGLDKALKEIGKKSKDLQAELRQVERLLKLDPTNSELLAQKQKLLAEAVGETKKKLDALKQAEAQAQQQFREGKEVPQEAYRALQREIAYTEQDLKKLEKQAKETGGSMSASAKELAGHIGAAGEKMTSAGKSLLPVTGAIVGAGAAAVAAMDKVDEGLDTVMTKTGATGEAAQELQEVYNAVAKTVPADFADIGAAVGEVNTRLGFTGEALEQAATDFLEFAKVNGADVNTSVQLVTRAMGDAGIAAEDYNQVLDALTVAGQQSGISVDTLATNLAKYGAPLRALGIETEEAIAMFAGWEKAGVNTETAFSGMKKAISTWSAEGKDARAEFAKTMQTIKDAPDISAATTLAIEAFGAKAGPDLADAIQGGRFEVDKYITALQNAGGAVDATYGMIVDEVDDTALASQNLQVALHDTGDTIAKTLGPILLSLAEKVSAVLEWFNGLDDETKKVILTIAGLVAAVGPVLIVAGKIATGVSALITLGSTLGPIITGLTTGTGALATAFKVLTGPVGLAIAAITAAILVIKHLWETNEDFRDAVKQIAEQIKGIVSTAVNFIKDKFGFLWTAIQQGFNAFKALFSGDFSGFFEGLKSLAATLIQGFKNIGSDIVSYIKDGLSGAWSSLASWVSDKVSWLKDKLMFWRSGQDEISGGSASGGGAGRVDGSHRLGLPYVPFDGYIAELHKGERVLTAKEARQSQGATITNNFKIEKMEVRDDKDLDRLSEKLYRKQALAARGRGLSAW